MNAKHRREPLKHIPTLSELLGQVLERFSGSRPEVYSFTLGHIAGAWEFKVVNSCKRWVAANRQHGFGPHSTPEAAVQAFLNYVREHRIDVGGLMD